MDTKLREEEFDNILVAQRRNCTTYRIFTAMPKICSGKKAPGKKGNFWK
jgi:hypothetical protein